MIAPLSKAGRELEAARRQLERAMHIAADEANAARAAGMTEVGIARALGVNRLTVRRWLGK